MLIGSGQLLSQPFHLFLQLVYGFVSRVVINGRLIGDIGSFGGVGQSGYIFLEKKIVGAYACDHQTVTISADRLLQYRCQFRISVGNVSLLLLVSDFGRLCKYTYHLPQSEQRFVYVNTLFCLSAFCASQTDSL